jgi:hypothetical protein
MTYTHPKDVDSPKGRWQLIDVLLPGKEGHEAIAFGKWDGNFVLAIRWNGNKESPVGNPQSRGYPTWFILPEVFYGAILEKLVDEQRRLVEAFVKFNTGKPFYTP